MMVIHFTSVSSTQDIAKSILKENVAIVADEMKNGYGRMRRKWYAPYGGLWMTAIFKKIENPQIMNLAGGIAVAKSLENFNIKTGLKWPNDVLLNGKKLCGIMGEVYGDFILLGIGINLKNEIPDELRDIAVNAPALDRNSLLPILLENLENEIKKKKEEIIEDWKKYDITLGKKVKIIDEKKEIIGIACGIDDNGFLILINDKKTIKVFAGDLRFL